MFIQYSCSYNTYRVNSLVYKMNQIYPILPYAYPHSHSIPSSFPSQTLSTIHPYHTFPLLILIPVSSTSIRLPQAEGVKGLYKGFWVSNLMVASQLTYLVTYESARQQLSNSGIDSTKAKSFIGGGVASLAGLC